MNELVGLKNVILLYLAFRDRAQAGQQNREAYIVYVSKVLKTIGDGLRIIEKHFDELQSQDLREQLRLHQVWDNEHLETEPGRTTLERLENRLRREPQAGRIIKTVRGTLTFAFRGPIEILRAQIKVPKRLQPFDNLLHSLGIQVDSLVSALARIIRGDTSDMQEVNFAMKGVVPLFSETLERYEKILRK